MGVGTAATASEEDEGDLWVCPSHAVSTRRRAEPSLIKLVSDPCWGLGPVRPRGFGGATGLNPIHWVRSSGGGGSLARDFPAS